MQAIAKLIKKFPFDAISANPDRVWGKVLKTDAGCWNWQGRIQVDGYGQMSAGNAEILAHRAAYFLANGMLPNGLCIMHKCDNPRCCNPDHLIAGTHAQNMADMRLKGRRKGICLGNKNGRAKLNPDTVKKIRDERAAGLRLIDLSKKFSVGVSTVSRVCRMENWK